MKVWDNIKTWGAKLLQRTASATGIAREYKDIFELGGVPAFKQFYDCGVFVWKALYRGLYKPWHIVPVIAVGARPGETRQLYRLNIAKAVSAELASLVWDEECEISAGWEEQVDEDGVVVNPDPLKGFIADVLDRNAFGEKLQELIEQSLAAGGYEVNVAFDDGVTQDRQTSLNEGVMLVGAGLLSKYTFLTNRKYGQGLTEKDALAELERIKAEKLNTVEETQVRLFGGGA